MRTAAARRVGPPPALDPVPEISGDRRVRRSLQTCRRRVVLFFYSFPDPFRFRIGKSWASHDLIADAPPRARRGKKAKKTAYHTSSAGLRIRKARTTRPVRCSFSGNGLDRPAEQLTSGTKNRRPLQPGNHFPSFYQPDVVIATTIGPPTRAANERGRLETRCPAGGRSTPGQ